MAEVVRWIGIDPGVNGGIAVLEGQSRIDRCKLSEGEHEASEFLREVASRPGGTFAALERVRSSPQMGVVSSFTFGAGYGFLKGLLVAYRIPYEEVLPIKWQKALGCRTKGNKNITKAKAAQLFPEYRWTHATADAVLIAAWARKWGIQGVQP